MLIPLIAIHYTGEVAWTLSDFIIAGILLFGTGFSYKLVTMKSETLIYRAAVATALGSGLLLIWSNLAVGIIGSENNEANLMYFGVLLVLILGSALARFRPKEMAMALFATAFAQATTIVIALSAGMQHYPHSSMYEIILVNGFFITLFVISALLFRHADERDANESEDDKRAADPKQNASTDSQTANS